MLCELSLGNSRVKSRDVRGQLSVAAPAASQAVRTYLDMKAPHLILASLPSGNSSSGLYSTSTNTENSACIIGLNCCSKDATTS